MKSFFQVLIVFLSFLNMAFAGPSEEEVKKAIRKINADVQQINSLAQQGKIDESLDMLHKLNSFVNTEISWGALSYDMQKKAKKENPGFTFSLNTQLPEQFTTAYYDKKLSLCKKHMKLTDDTEEGLQAMKDLNNMDKLYAYLQMAKKSYDAAKDMMEDYSTGNVPKAIYDVYNNSKELYEGLKQIYDTHKDQKNIKSFEESVKMVVDRAENSKKKYESLIDKINLWKDDIADFNSNMRNILKIKNQVVKENVSKMSFADRKYNWDYGPFQKKVKEACDDFEKYDIKCPEFQKNYDEIIADAKKDWEQIKKNINGSDDNDNKPKFLTDLNNQWADFKGVVEPIFQKAYNKSCGAVTTKTEETKTTTGTDRNTRSLYIKDLALGSPSGMIKLYFEPRAEVKVTFKAIWDGQWLDRVKMKILIDNSEIVNEMLEFRDNMGKFRTDFSKTIQLPSSLDNGSHTLSLVMERDPKILNKSITLSCSPTQVNFKVGEETSNATTKSNVTADMFSGASAKTKAEVIPEKKTTGKSSSVATNKSSDKYWENTIPDNAHKEWAIIKDGSSYTYEVKYSVNGRTVGYRAFSDPEFKNPKWESIRNNLAVKHGAQRKFSCDKEGNYFVSEIEFYRANKRMGNRLTLDSKGEIKYGKKLDYVNEKLMTHIPSEPQLSLANIAITGNVDYTSIKLPSNPIKLISYVSSDYSERYYAPNVLKQHMGTYTFTGREFRLRSASIRSGPKVVRWYFGYYVSSPKEITTYLLGDRSLFFQDYYIQDKYRVGKKISKKKTEIYLYGKKVDKQTYLNAKAKDSWLPSLADGDALLAQPFKVQNYPDPVWATSNPLNLFIEEGSQLWRVEMTDYSTDCFYVNNHNISGLIGWHENKKQSLLEVYRDMHQIYRIRWNKEGQLNGAHIRGHIYNEGLRISVKDGKIQSNYENTSLPYYSYSKTYAKIKNTPSLEVLDSPRLTDVIDQPKFPQAEITPLFKDIWNGIKIDYSAPTSESIIEQNQFANSQTEKSETEQSDQAAIDAEFSKLMDEIRKIEGQADISFNKKYWNDPNSSRVTMNETNPKQEAMDILRKAIPIVDRAKYPGPKLMAYHMLAMHFTDYSGRVIGNKGKQAFFLEAAQLINKADQLMPQLRSMGNQALSNFYVASAEVWREMTRKAQWGNHAYNKMECDKKVIQQYERALSIDPNNAKAKKMLEQLKAPKKAVPAAVAQFKEIEPETWNNAQTIMVQLDHDILGKETKTEIHPIEIADMTLETGTGKVEIMRSGVRSWKTITYSHILIFVGDKIKTGPNAKGVSVSYTSDNAYLAIKPDAEVEFYSDNKLLIRRGDTYVDVTKKGSKFLVITPTCAVGVRGTTFEVRVAPDKTTETFLYEGVVEARSGSDVGYLVPGQKIVAKKDAPKLEQTNFNVQKRLASDWRDVESQKRNHEQLKLAAVKKSSTPAARATVKPRKSNTSVSVYPLHVSPSPNGQYHELLSKSAVEYGDALLVARCPMKVSRNTPLTVNWYLNNQTKAINVGNYQVVPGASFFDAAIISYDAPLNPGSYRAEFVMGGKVIGRNTIKITAPKRLDAKTAQEFYVETVKALDLSLTTLGQGNFAQAGQLCGEAMPILRAALYSAPNLPDIFTVMHASQSLYALGQADAALRNSDNQRALLWVTISKGYVDRALEKCQDAQLKTSLQNLQALIGQIQSKLN